MDVYDIRQAAREAGRDTFTAVREYLENLDDAQLETNLVEIESRKTKRPKKRDAKIKLITARVCQGDAFLTSLV